MISIAQRTRFSRSPQSGAEVWFFQTERAQGGWSSQFAFKPNMGEHRQVVSMADFERVGERLNNMEAGEVFIYPDELSSNCFSAWKRPVQRAMRSTSSSEISSTLRSYSFVVRGLS